jgi:hypothetical protein
MKTRLAPVWIVALVLVAFRPAGAQTPYHDDALHWGLTIPPGWAAKSEKEITDLNDEVHRRAPNSNFRFVAGFRVDPEGPLFPYILVQRTEIPFKGASYEDLEKTFGAKEFKQAGRDFVKKSASDLLKSADFGTPRLERSTNRVFLDLKMSDTSGHALRGLSVMHLTPDGAVQLNFYSRSETFDQDIAKFDPFLASFKLDPGNEFVAGRGFDWTRVGVKAGVGAGVGILVAIASLLKRRGAKPAQS